MGLIRRYPHLWGGCVGAWCPSRDNSRSTILTDKSRYNRSIALGVGKFVDDYLLCVQGADNQASVAIGGYPLTLSCWFNASSLQALNPGLLTVGQELTVNYYAIIGMQTNKLWIMTRGSGYNEAFSTADHPINSWNHLCGTFSETTGTLYLNGVSVATITTGTETNFDTVKIGGTVSRSDSDSFDYQGKADSSMIHTRILSLSEIQLLATRRGIEHETKRLHRGYVASTTNRRRRLLMAG